MGRSEQRIRLESERLHLIFIYLGGICPAIPKQHGSEGHCHRGVPVEDCKLFLELALGPDIILVEICDEFASRMGDAGIPCRRGSPISTTWVLQISHSSWITLGILNSYL